MAGEKRDYYEVLGVPRSASLDDIKRAMEELNRATHDFSKNIYEEAARKRASEQGPPPEKEKGRGGGGDGGGGGSGEKIIDADFKTK